MMEDTEGKAMRNGGDELSAWQEEARIEIVRPKRKSDVVVVVVALGRLVSMMGFSGTHSSPFKERSVRNIQIKTSLFVC